MRVELSDEQVEAIAIHWIREQADYKTIFNALFAYGTCSDKWAWTDALSYAVKLCGKNFCSDKKRILKELAK